MATVTKRSANWRLFGGGGLLVAGILWTLSLLLGLAGIAGTSPWLDFITLLILVVGLVIVAFGQTGSNGAVGDSTLGKLFLVLYAAGWLLFAISWIVSLGTVVGAIAALLVIVGGLLSAWFIYQKGIAKGIARWVLFLPAIFGALWVAGNQGWIPALAGQTWLALLVAVLFAVTGLLYLFNDRKVG
jgi:hypothetical protein